MIHKSNPRTHFFAVVAACIFGFFAMSTNVFADASDCDLQSAILSQWEAYAESTATNCNPKGISRMARREWCTDNFPSDDTICFGITEDCTLVDPCIGGGDPGGGDPGGGGGNTGGGGVDVQSCSSADIVIELVSETEVASYSYWNTDTPLFGYPFNRCGLASCAYCGSNVNVYNDGNGWISIIDGAVPADVESGLHCASIGTRYHIFERCSKNSGCRYEWRISRATVPSCDTCGEGLVKRTITDVMLMQKNVDYYIEGGSSGLEDLLNMFRSSEQGLRSEDDVYICVQCLSPGWSDVSGQTYQEKKGNKCQGNESTKEYRCKAGYKGNVASVSGSPTGLTCTACPSGTYQPQSGKTECLPCPNFGTTSASTSPTGATDITSCFVNCAPSPLYTDNKGTFRLTTGCSDNKCYYSE